MPESAKPDPHRAGKNSPEAIVAEDGAQLDFRNDMSYGDYLQLDLLLGAQKPLSGERNELLFIIQHQATELHGSGT